MKVFGWVIKFRRKDVPPKAHVTASQDSGRWTFAVRDKGVGIDAQLHNRIFTIFQRPHTRDECARTGIRLATCRKIVESGDGRIWGQRPIKTPFSGLQFQTRTVQANPDFR
jgi:two-component system, chemotaxis family, sensor kinase Cph1